MDVRRSVFLKTTVKHWEKLFREIMKSLFLFKGLQDAARCWTL